MNLLEKYPTIIAQRGDKFTLNANITKKLTENELAELENKWSGKPKNEQLYCELIGSSRGCIECGEPVKFVNFSQGYKELCSKCKVKAVTAAGQKTIAETKGEIVSKEEVDKWLDYLHNDSKLSVDKWTQHTRAHNKNVWWTIKQSVDTKTWMEALYRWENSIDGASCKTCGRPTRFARYTDGYKTYCCAICARKDKELIKQITKAGSATKLKKLAAENTGKTCYCNFIIYDNPVEANKKYANYYELSHEEFDNKVPVLDWCSPMDYKQRWYYYTNNIKEQKVCHCGNKITNYNIDHCSVKCINNNPAVREKIKNTNIEKYGVVHYSKHPDRNDRVRQTNINKYGVEFPAQNEDCKRKAIETNKAKYGSEWYTNSTSRTMMGYKYHDYTYPRGEVIQVQGYEPMALDDLLLEYNEYAVLAGKLLVTDITYIGKDGNIHRYYPDILVTITNTIIEVKSQWTLEKGLEDGSIQLKQKASLDAGYNFQLRVYSADRTWYEYKLL